MQTDSVNHSESSAPATHNPPLAAMHLEPRKLSGLYEVHLAPFRDQRGYLSRVYDPDRFQEAGLKAEWVQHVISHTKHRNILRGLHAQQRPFSEAKLIIPLSGEMFWVVVDLRRDSPTFGQWEGSFLSAEKENGLYISRGFGHGCLSMTDDVLLSILADNRYSPKHGLGIRWDDPELGVKWPQLEGKRMLSDEHNANPDFKHFRKTVGGL